jgi:hypothetical protein
VFDEVGGCYGVGVEHVIEFGGDSHEVEHFDFRAIYEDALNKSIHFVTSLAEEVLFHVLNHSDQVVLFKQQ